MTEFLSKAAVLRRTSLTHASLYREIKAKRFPSPVKITEGRVAWIASEVDQWAEARVAESRVVSR